MASTLRQYSTQFEELLLSKNIHLTAAEVYSLFVPSYSAEGSNARVKELEIMTYWLTFLEECESELLNEP